jgi:hypothetical protein
MECCIVPPNASLSLHDCTDFCIISRVLYGDITSTMFATALTLGQTIQPPLEVLRSACYGLFELYQPHTLHVHSLSARGKRFQIEAGHQGAPILDVLTPPDYSHNRDCTFYRLQAIRVRNGQRQN